jgi:winged helix-turn helix protein
MDPYAGDEPTAAMALSIGSDGTRKRPENGWLSSRIKKIALATAKEPKASAPRLVGYSRDSFYRFKELYDAGGELALQELTRRKPILRNRTPPDVEAIIVELSLDRPAYGQKRRCKRSLTRRRLRRRK